MAYVPPTVADFTARFPALATVAEETIELRLDDAALECAHWPEELRARGELYLAAHRIVELGDVSDMAVQGVSQFRSADFAMSYGKAAERTGLNATVYGREHERLARVAFSGPRIVA